MNDIEVVQNQQSFEKSNILNIEDIVYDIEDYDLFNEKDFKKYINDIEKIVRQSREYKTFIQYLRNFMNMNHSLFMPNVSNIDTTKIKIELHHTPFTLYDIVMTIFNKRKDNDEPLSCFLVAKEVCYIHYFLYVGLIPLSKTEHKLVHNQSLFVPIDKVLGRYDRFIEMYDKYIPEDAMARYNTYKEMTNNYNFYQNTQILNLNPTYIQHNRNNYLGSYNSAELQNIFNISQNILDTKKNKQKSIIDSRYDSITKQELIKPVVYVSE